MAWGTTHPPTLIEPILHMDKKITVKTEKGKPDSLKRPITVAFTFTPDEPNGPSHPYNTLALRPTSFGVNGEETTQYVAWRPQFIIGLYTIQNRIPTPKGLVVHSLPPGNAVTLDSSTSWSSPVRHDDAITSSSVLVINESGSKQAILAASWGRQIAYHPLETGSSIAIPSSWKFQAYIVDDSVTAFTILQSEDLTCPILPAPVLCNTLPERSTWILCEDEDGVVQLKKDQFNTVKPKPPKKDPLVEVLERLAAMEVSINRIQDDATTGQKAVDDLRNQFSASNGEVRSSITALAGSFDQSQAHLVEVQQAMSGTQQLLDGTCSRVSTLEKSSAAVEKAVHQTQDHVSVVQQLVVATNTQLSMAKLIPGTTAVPEPHSPSQGREIDAPKGPPDVDARVEKLEKEQRKVLRKLPKLEASIAALDSRVSAVEAGSGDEEHLASSPSLEASPVTFPTHLND